MTECVYCGKDYRYDDLERWTMHKLNSDKSVSIRIEMLCPNCADHVRHYLRWRDKA